MKLGEGGEAFFVFETSEQIPESLQTSPVISPATTPNNFSARQKLAQPTLQEPEFLDLNLDDSNPRRTGSILPPRPIISDSVRAKSDFGGA